jgi:hypothetical protein
VNEQSTSLESRKLLYVNVAVSEKGLAEFSGNRRIVFIPKDQVRNVEIKFGPQAERPIVQAIVALALIGLGVAGLFMLAADGLAAIRLSLGFLVFGGLGVWLLYEASKTGFYLRVICPNDTRKLAFKGVIQKAELLDFTKNAAQLGYDFRDCLNGKDIS